MAQAKKAAKAGLTFHLFAVNLLEKLVEVFRSILTSNFLEFCIKWVTRIGHFALILAAVLGLLFGIIAIIRGAPIVNLLLGVVFLLLVFVVQYTATRFLDTGETLIKNNPTQLSSKAFLDCFGFLTMIGGVVILVISIVELIKGGTIHNFLMGLANFIILELLALLAFNPDEITIKIAKGNSAGQEAIGIVTFFIKSFLRLVPIFFGVLIVIGTIMLLIALIKLFGRNPAFAWAQGEVYAKQILSAGLLPFIAYILFALLYLCIDVIRSILSIPEKLDKLGKK